LDETCKPRRFIAFSRHDAAHQADPRRPPSIPKRRAIGACRTAATVAAELNIFIVLLFCPFGQISMGLGRKPHRLCLWRSPHWLATGRPLLCISADKYDKFDFI
jgi:hypothetical protein